MSDRGKSSLLRDDDIIFFDFFYKQIAHSFLHTLRVQPIVRLSYGLQTPPSGASTSGMTCRMLVPVPFCRPANHRFERILAPFPPAIARRLLLTYYLTAAIE